MTITTKDLKSISLDLHTFFDKEISIQNQLCVELSNLNFKIQKVIQDLELGTPPESPCSLVSEYQITLKTTLFKLDESKIRMVAMQSLIKDVTSANIAFTLNQNNLKNKSKALVFITKISNYIFKSNVLFPSQFATQKNDLMELGQKRQGLLTTLERNFNSLSSFLSQSQ